MNLSELFVLAEPIGECLREPYEKAGSISANLPSSVTRTKAQGHAAY